MAVEETTIKVTDRSSGAIIELAHLTLRGNPINVPSREQLLVVLRRVYGVNVSIIEMTQIIHQEPA